MARPLGMAIYWAVILAVMEKNFLDRLKAAVNGPNSTTPVQITIGPLQLWKSGFSGFASSILMAFLYNLNLIADFTLWFIVIAAIGGIIAWGT